MAGDAPRRGRPPAVPASIKAVAEDYYLKGYSPSEIQTHLKGLGYAVSDRTIRTWADKGGWKTRLGERRSLPGNLDTEISRLAAKKTITTGDAQKLAMLSKTRQRMRVILPTAKPRPVVLAALHKDLLAKALAPEYGLRSYQARYLTSTARFLLRLKARQIGFSWVIALKVVLKAASGRPQLVVSASERQAKALLGLVVKHCELLGITPDDVSSDTVTIAGTKITALPPNAATIQGFPGDVTIDEAAWIRNLKKIWEAIIPS
ncbi:MAG: terminase family protein, partial [Magnetospirillum sp.]|nr:terminase family protein [Magnetospirillum sp.]